MCTLRGDDWASKCVCVCARVCTQMFPPAHIQCHHSNNQPPRKPDWIINRPINASLHSVILSASKYLPMQNNPRRLDYHFKLSLCAVHNQGGEEGCVMRESRGRQIGRKVLLLHFYAESQTSYAFGFRWGVCVWQGRVSAGRYKTSLPSGFGL